jgi:hypothetical protein
MISHIGILKLHYRTDSSAKHPLSWREKRRKSLRLQLFSEEYKSKHAAKESLNAFLFPAFFVSLSYFVEKLQFAMVVFSSVNCMSA